MKKEKIPKRGLVKWDYTKRKIKKYELSDDFYSFYCPHCKKRIILDEKKWISKE